MSNDHIAENSASVLAKLETHSNIPKKPPNLIKLIDRCGKTPKEVFFVSLEPVVKELHGLAVKGLYTEWTEEELAKDPYKFVGQINREEIMEMFFPWHNISSVRNLVYKAK